MDRGMARQRGVVFGFQTIGVLSSALPAEDEFLMISSERRDHGGLPEA